MTLNCILIQLMKVMILNCLFNGSTFGRIDVKKLIYSGLKIKSIWFIY